MVRLTGHRQANEAEAQWTAGEHVGHIGTVAESGSCIRQRTLGPRHCVRPHSGCAGPLDAITPCSTNLNNLIRLGHGP